MPLLPCSERTEDKMPISNGIREQASREMICDFCSSRDVFYAYLAADFIAAEVVVPTAGTFALNSLGAWLACRECTDLIEGERWQELLDRSFRTFREIHGAELGMTEEDEPRIRELLRQIHAGFRRFRAGEPPPDVKHKEKSAVASASEGRALRGVSQLPN
jgi:hypothetical protein